MHFQVGQPITADQAMELAIKKAKEGLGFVSPNPPVGCVVVDKEHCFLSSGAHLKWGESHAEINAINQIQNPSLLVGATLYVTLEPCSHIEKTGSCAKHLAQLPIKKVCYGTMDPNPKVNGRGLGLLKAHNKEIQHFKKHQLQCEKLCEQFLFHIKNQKPFVALKVGASLDGKIALQSGQSQWITSKESRHYGRVLRAHYDATLIGAGTFLKDDPKLDFRGTKFENKKNNRVIVFDPKDKAHKLFQDSKVKKLHAPETIFVLTPKKQSWEKTGVQTILWDKNWSKVLLELYQKEITSIFVEGGAYVFGQFLQQKLAQKLYLFQSPKILGSGLSWTQCFENKELSQAPKLHPWQSQNMGEDQLHIAYF